MKIFKIAQPVADPEAMESQRQAMEAQMQQINSLLSSLQQFMTTVPNTQSQFNKVNNDTKIGIANIQKELNLINNTLSTFMNNLNTQLSGLEKLSVQMSEVSSSVSHQQIGPFNVQNTGPITPVPGPMTR